MVLRVDFAANSAVDSEICFLNDTHFTIVRNYSACQFVIPTIGKRDVTPNISMGVCDLQYYVFVYVDIFVINITV